MNSNAGPAISRAHFAHDTIVHRNNDIGERHPRPGSFRPGYRPRKAGPSFLKVICLRRVPLQLPRPHRCPPAGPLFMDFYRVTRPTAGGSANKYTTVPCSAPLPTSSRVPQAEIRNSEMFCVYFLHQKKLVPPFFLCEFERGGTARLELTHHLHRGNYAQLRASRPVKIKAPNPLVIFGGGVLGVLPHTSPIL